MGKETNIAEKLRKIGELMGTSIFRIGVDAKTNRIDILSVSAVLEEPSEPETEKVTFTLPESPDYIG
jgi:hypothetical protein